MPVEVYSPEPWPQIGDQYAVEKNHDLLRFAVRLKTSEINLDLPGQPDDFLFFSDIENMVDIVLRKYNWVAKFIRGSADFCIVYGFFSRPDSRGHKIVFLDEDALIMGPDTPIAAAVYRIEDATLLEATYVLNELHSCSPAEVRRLLPSTAFHSSN